MTDACSRYGAFISYSRKDGLRYAERLERELSAAGFATWRDKRDLDPDQDFTAALEHAIEQSDRVLCCVTPDIKRDNSFVRREIGYALAVHKPIVPLVFEGTVPPVHIINLTHEDFTRTSWDKAFAALLARLGRSENAALQTTLGDPHHDYLNALYREIVDYLKQTVISEITLLNRSTPDAVREQAVRALPVAFWRAAGTMPQSSAPRKTFASFQEAVTEYTGRVLLLGEPGAGKTTTLFAFARDRVAERLQDPGLPLPVIARIAAGNHDRRMSLPDWLAEQVPMLNGSDIGRLYDAGDLLLMLDGLDELGSQRKDLQTEETYDPRICFLNATPRKGQVIITCRAQEYMELGEKVALGGAVTLTALNDAQISEYLRGLPYLWYFLQSEPDLLEIVRNPLLLSLFAYAFSEIREQNDLLLLRGKGLARDTIFETYVSSRYEHERLTRAVGVDLGEIYHILGPAALAAYLADYSSDLTPILEEICGRQGRLQQVNNLATDFVNLHLLVRETSGGLRFIHLRLREHFAQWAQKHVADWKPQMVKLVGSLRTAGALNLLSSWFPDPEVGELAENAAWSYFNDAPGLGSSVRMALDRWEEYKERHRS
jgi:nucleoside 2-deoxyribosyltransferase